MTKKRKNRRRYDFRLYDRVRIRKTGEEAFIVRFDDLYPEHDSFLLDLAGRDEMPKFYRRADFDVIGE